MLSHFLEANSAVKTAKRFFDIIKKNRWKNTYLVNKNLLKMTAAEPQRRTIKSALKP